MKGFLAFTKKEIIENLRTYKIFVLFIVFFIFGLMSPFVAKMTPEIMNMLPMDGIKIEIPTPVALDSYAQYYNNVAQMGILIFIAMFGGMISRETGKGTLTNILTKGLSRDSVILSKYVTAAGIWSASVLISILTTYAYTIYTFKGEYVPHIFISVLSFWLFGLFLLAALIFFAAIFKSSYSALLCTALLVILLSLFNLVPRVKKYNPNILITNNVGMLSKEFIVSDLRIPIILSVSMSALFICGAVMIFRKRQI